MGLVDEADVCEGAAGKNPCEPCEDDAAWIDADTTEFFQPRAPEEGTQALAGSSDIIRPS